MPLTYCPRCNKLFAKTSLRDICMSCQQELDKQYDIVIDYIKKHRGLTIQDIAEATEVSVKTITKWIREGRISFDNDSHNIAYPCEVCGTTIFEGRLCDKCRTRLTNERKNAELLPSQSQLQRENAYQINDRLNKERK